MTIQEALKQAQEILGEDVHVSIECTLWPDRAPSTACWIYADDLPNGCVSSYRSWEHALAIAKSCNDDCWPEVEEEVAYDET